MRIYILLLVSFFSSYLHLNDLFAQKYEGDAVVIFIKDLNAMDYYSLQSVDPEERKFEILESCIPKGFLLIKYPNKLTLKEEMDHCRKLVLKNTAKEAIFTSFTVDQMHQLCTEIRKDLSDD